MFGCENDQKQQIMMVYMFIVLLFMENIILFYSTNEHNRVSERRERVSVASFIKSEPFLESTLCFTTQHFSHPHQYLLLTVEVEEDAS